MTSRQRLIKVAAGVGMVALGCVIFYVSKDLDPMNRAALLSIIAIFVGLTWLGQGIRGHRELVVHHEDEVAPTEVIPATKAATGLFLAWLVPGLGHYHVGRKQKGILYFCVITATFAAGVLLAQGRNMSYERDAVYFLAYIFNGAETGLAWLLTSGLEFDRPIPNLQVGFLYSAVASLLNLVVVIDLFNTCTRHRRVDE